MSKFPPKLRPEIPKAPLTLRGTFKHFLKTPPSLNIDIQKAPYTNGELAWIKANQEAFSSFRRQAVSIVTSLLTLIFFLCQTTPLIPLSERAHFLSAPFDQTGFVLYWYTYFVLLGITVLLLAVVCGAFMVLFVIAPKITWEKVKELDLFESVGEFDLYRTFPYFAVQTLGLVSSLWIVQALFQIDFTINDPSGATTRMLSAFEFLYFFFISYTTLGYGDIVPHSYGARVILLVINCYTILSLVYWYGAIAKGPRHAKVKEHLKRLYRKHLRKVSEKRGWMKTAVRLLAVMERGDTPYCPLFLDKKHGRKPCPLCHGSNRVSEDVFFAYAVRHGFRSKRFMQRVPGLTKAHYKKVLEIIKDSKKKSTPM